MATLLEQTRERLASLIKVSQLLTGAVEPEELIATVLDSAMQLFAAEGGAVALIDDAEQQLAFVTVRGGGVPKIADFRLTLGQGIIGWVAQTGQGVVCNDVS